jgi:hypothetical protein
VTQPWDSGLSPRHAPWLRRLVSRHHGRRRGRRATNRAATLSGEPARSLRARGDVPPSPSFRALFGLTAASCASSFGGTTPSRFLDPAAWARFRFVDAPRVSAALPGVGAASACAGDGHHRTVCVSTSDVHDSQGVPWTRVDVALRCGDGSPASISSRSIDGHPAYLYEARDLTSGRPLATHHRARDGTMTTTYENRPLLRRQSLCVPVDGKLLVLTYRGPEESWDADGMLRDALFGSVRIADDVGVRDAR